MILLDNCPVSCVKCGSTMVQPPLYCYPTATLCGMKTPEHLKFPCRCGWVATVKCKDYKEESNEHRTTNL